MKLGRGFRELTEDPEFIRLFSAPLTGEAILAALLSNLNPEYIVPHDGNKTLEEIKDYLINGMNNEMP